MNLKRARVFGEGGTAGTNGGGTVWTGFFGVEEGWDCSSMRVMVQNQGGMSVST